MKQLIALAILCLSSAAQAQPGMAPQASRCEVTIARAPDDVRNVVESWVKAEPTCTVKLEVRIIPTQGGLYLLARDEFGRVRERVVPDAQSAGVLVASWMAADSHGGQTPYDIRRPVAAAPAPAPAPMLGAERSFASGEAQGPGAVPVIAEKPAASREPRWLSIGGMFGMSGDGGGGVRTEYDWRQYGRATFGFLASASTSSLSIYDPNSYDYMASLQAFDAKLLAYLALGARSGKWALRSSFGAGVVYTHMTLIRSWGDSDAGGVFPTGEAAISVQRDLGANWALTAGPVVSLYIQKYQVEDATYYYNTETERRDLDVMMYIAARYRL